MRRLIASSLVSLDGSMQAPGGPDEDPAGGRALGGWSVDCWDRVMGCDLFGLHGAGRELVLGRRTYEIFEAHWARQPAGDPIAQAFHAARKHVATRRLKTLYWRNSSLLQGNATHAVSMLKAQEGLDLQIIGSASLIQSLHAAGLIDEYRVWTFPFVLGRGKRLFDAGAAAGSLRLVSSLVSRDGVLMSIYRPAGVPLETLARVGA